MPKVPSYDSFQVSLDAGQSARVQAPEFQDFSGKQQQQFGQAIEKAGQGLLAGNMYAERMVSTATAKGGDNNGMGFVDQLFYNGQSGYMNKVGKDAVDSRDAVIQQLNDGLNKIEESLPDGAKALYAPVKQQRLQQAMAQIDQHYAKQSHAYGIGETTSNLQNQFNNAALNWTNPQLVAQSYASAKDQFEQLAQLQGWGGEQLKEKERGFNTAYVGTMVNKMIGDNNPTAARQFLDSHAELVDQSKVDDLRKLVKTAGVKDESLKLALGMSAGNLQGNIKQADSLFQAGKIDAETYDALTQRIHQRYQEAKAGESDYEKNLIGQAQKYIVENKVTSILDLPPQMQSALAKTGHYGTVESFARQGGNPKTDTARYVELRQMANNDPAAFSQVNLAGEIGKISKEDLGGLLTLQGSINKQDVKTMQTQKQVDYVVKSINTDIKAAMGADFGKTTDKRYQQGMADFNDALYREIDQAIQNGVKDPKELRSIGLELLQQQRISRSGIFSFMPDKTKRVFQMSEDDIGGIGFDQIPSADAAEISKTLSSKGIQPTNDKIVEVYTKHLKALKGLN